MRNRAMRRAAGFLLAACAWADLCAAAEGSGAAAGGAVAVLSDQTLWRTYVVYRPAVVAGGEARDAGKGDSRRGGEDLSTPLPQKDWARADLDDSGWLHRRTPLFCDGRAKGVALICLRGRFLVTDPAGVKGLQLALRYRGGAVAYLNGTEVARGHLPPGRLEPLTLAEAYPRRTFVTPGGEALLPDYGKRQPPADVADRFQARDRTLTARIPPAALRKGANVLAIELHRTALPADLPTVGGRLWDTVGLAEVLLSAAGRSAVVPNPAPPGLRRAHVWNADPLERIDPAAQHGDALEPCRAIQLLAPRNGVCCGQVVVSSPEPIDRLSAGVSDLRSAGGAVIPAGAVRIRYPRLGEPFIALLDEPIGGARTQPIWLTVKVPPAATPGAYAGTLTIDGPFDAPRTVPVELRVFGWRVGEPAQWRTWVNLLQSPESVAGHYKVPMWSDRHFELIARSLELMGQCGNDCLGVSAVGRSVFGDDPLIVFRKSGASAPGYVPELRFLRRYLRLYDAAAGEPKFLSVHVWSYGMYQKGWGRDGGSRQGRAGTIPVVELRDGKLVPIELPMYGRPGTEPLWRDVMDGVRRCAAELGWKKARILVGTSGDTWPSEETVSFFRRVAPYATWRVLTHGGGCPKWGASTLKRTQPNGMTVGYLEIARRVGSRREKLADHPVTCNSRDKVGSDPFTYLALPAVTASAGYDGVCWKGIDYWPYTAADGTKRSALNTYVHFGNMVGGTPRAMAAAGPDGAVTTVQLEMLREGIQHCEAMLAVREGLEALHPQPTRSYDTIELFLKDALVRESRRESRPDEMIPKDLELTLYERGDGLAALSHAPTYNVGKHAAQAKALDGRAALKLDVRVTIEDDPWVKGGQGTYSLQLRREGNAYTGTYAGVFRGVQRQGTLIGTFRPKGLRVPVGAPPPRTPLARRAEAAIAAVLSRFETAARAGARGGGLRPLVARLYEAASEVADAVEADRPQKAATAARD